MNSYHHVKPVSLEAFGSAADQAFQRYTNDKDLYRSLVRDGICLFITADDNYQPMHRQSGIQLKDSIDGLTKVLDRYQQTLFGNEPRI